ncbi:acyl-CoA thioesterase [Mycolicibacterium goodii]|uniref:acyl-CoA thioesterase n=1 Tax=Mycolicibacterium goodii TaxID=134601 RepID=UPI001BDD2623|nr:thioesterase family protein [Mycolicibacterium goodii]MBU8808131.1 thioesterase family protein [Mycolicibacterium goodii]MBU8829855.1 thioesterase family protein [Mycolicibacterium goodii]
MSVFDKAIDLQPDGDGRFRGSTVPEWANMVGPFGGITAAALVRAIQLHPECHGDPIAVTVNYVAPIADGDFDVETKLVRTNRSNQHWIVEQHQSGEVKTTATAVFGVRRDTWGDAELAAPPALDPDGLAQAESPLTWFSNYDIRYVDGAVPTIEGTASASSTTTLWVRNNPPRPLDFAALTAVGDIFYPRVFRRRGQFLPAGTVTLTIYFHASGDEITAAGADYVLGTARAHQFTRGYFDQTAHLWSRGGTPLATSHQYVYFKG